MHLLPNLHSFDRFTWWRDGPSAVAVAVAEVALVSLLALQLARLVWLVLAPAGPIGAAAPAATVAQPAPAVLPKVDVFFRSTAAPATGNDEALGYTLYGVRRDAAGGSAILGKDGNQASYAVGGHVAPGIVLERVGTDHAVLATNGTRHRLDLPRLAGMGGDGSPTHSLPVGAPQSQPVSTAASTDKNLPRTAPASPPPAQPDGGYTITAGARAAMLRPAGLLPGDVVLSVNGRPLDPTRLAGLREELKGGARLAIQYRRDGQTHTTILQAP